MKDESRAEAVYCYFCDLLGAIELLLLYLLQVILMEKQRMHHRLLLKTFLLGSLSVEHGMDCL